jgi:glycosyltransferase involved in cell wall biosynthesis
MSVSQLSQQLASIDLGERRFSRLTATGKAGAQRSLRICILSPEISGSDTNGGIGVSYVNLALTLASTGHSVTILHVCNDSYSPEASASWRSRFKERGICYEAIEPAAAENFIGTSHMMQSWQAYQWLKERQFQIVHAPACLGLPFYSLLAKKQGLAFQDTYWRVGLHGPSAWVRMANQRNLDHVSDVVADYLESRSVELADEVFAPCEYVLDWACQNGWILPEKSFVLPDLISVSANFVSLPRLAPESTLPVNEAAPDAGALAASLRPAFEFGGTPASQAVSTETNERCWLDWHQSVELPEPVLQPAEENDSRLPLVSICLTHFNRPLLLRQALDSVYAQDYPNLEVILVDDGSTSADAIALLGQLEIEFEERSWTVLRQKNAYVGAARNSAARRASGKYLLFMDDDNFALAHEVSTFVKVAEHRQADVLTCQLQMFEGDAPPNLEHLLSKTCLFLGDAATAGTIRNFFGDANALFRRDAFFQLGGFTEDFGVSHEDWEIFALAALSGLTLETIPEVLVWYRIGPDSMNRSTAKFKDFRRSLRPVENSLPRRLSGLAQLTQGLHFRVDQLVAENQVVNNLLKLATGDTARDLELLRSQLDLMWNSRSLSLLRPFRNFARALQRIPAERQPQPVDFTETLTEIQRLQSSFSWNITGPLRALGNLFQGRR